MRIPLLIVAALVLLAGLGPWLSLAVLVRLVVCWWRCRRRNACGGPPQARGAAGTPRTGRESSGPSNAPAGRG